MKLSDDRNERSTLRSTTKEKEGKMIQTKVHEGVWTRGGFDGEDVVVGAELALDLVDERHWC